MGKKGSAGEQAREGGHTEQDVWSISLGQGRVISVLRQEERQEGERTGGEGVLT